MARCGAFWKVTFAPQLSSVRGKFVGAAASGFVSAPAAQTASATRSDLKWLTRNVQEMLSVRRVLNDLAREGLVEPETL
jgi:hypothetical protein